MVRTGVLQPVIHRVGQRAVGARREILAAVRGGADEARARPLSSKVVSGLTVTSPVAPSIFETTFCVTVGRGPQELAGLPVQRVNDAGLAGNTGDHFAPLARLDLRIDPGHLARIRRDGCVDQQPLKRMIEIPVIDHVLVIPDDLAGIGIQRQRRVVIQILSCHCPPAGT